MSSLRDRFVGEDDPATLLAAGVLAYVTETMLHEAAGHGGICLAEGNRILVVAPLWMRCSETGWLLTAAGPAMNLIAACACMLLLLWRTWRGAAGLLLWLGFSFNALVACGYLGVGATIGFGDWPIILAGVAPAASWRLPAILLAIAGYYGCLRSSALLFGGIAGASPARDLRRRALLPAAGAALVACSAEIAGGRARLMPMLLAVGCTLGVGYSLTSMDDRVAAAGTPMGDAGIKRSVWLIGAGAVVGALFVAVIGPGLAL